jgi:hypothetical protein
MNLSQLDGKRIAVVLERDNKQIVACGDAWYEVDQDLGHCLRVEISETPGKPHIFFTEGAEGCEFERDSQYGCDYAVTVRMDAA